MPEFKYSFGQNVQLIFLNHFKVLKNRFILLKFGLLIILAIVIVLLVIGEIVVSFMKKKRVTTNAMTF